MQYWHTVNWANIQLYNESEKLLGRWHITIDHKIDLNFVHAQLDANAVTPTIDGWNVRYSKIWEYLVDKYKARIRRMISNGEPPIFVNFIQKTSDIIEIPNRQYKYISIAPKHILSTADIVYTQNSVTDCDNPISVVKHLSTEILDKLQQ